MSNAPDPATPAATSPLPEKLKRLPTSAAKNYATFCSSHDEAALTQLIIAVLVDHSPTRAGGIETWGDHIRLVEDVGFDSLAIAETVFFFEDLFNISINNEEIAQLGTIGELRAFIMRKAAVLAA